MIRQREIQILGNERAVLTQMTEYAKKLQTLKKYDEALVAWNRASILASELTNEHKIRLNNADLSLKSDFKTREGDQANTAPGRDGSEESDSSDEEDDDTNHSVDEDRLRILQGHYRESLQLKHETSFLLGSLYASMQDEAGYRALSDDEKKTFEAQETKYFEDAKHIRQEVSTQNGRLQSLIKLTSCSF